MIEYDKRILGELFSNPLKAKVNPLSWCQDFSVNMSGRKKIGT